MKTDSANLAFNGVTGTLSAMLIAFDLTWWAVIGAFLGSLASLHFNRSPEPKSWQRIAGEVLATMLGALVAAGSLHHVPLMDWSTDIPLAVRATGYGISINVLWVLGKRYAERRFAAGD